jgi:hypothetical protein
MNAVLKQLNACPCGFPALKDEIKLGARYQIDFDNLIDIKFGCGGCRQFFDCKAVFVHARFGSRAGYLPLHIFRQFTITETLYEFLHEFYRHQMNWPDSIPITPAERHQLWDENQPRIVSKYEFALSQFNGIPLRIFADAPQRRTELLKP